MLIGLVGCPSSGKSTFFSAATQVDVARASYPFTTINPNKGVGFVRVPCADVDFDIQCTPRSGYCVNHTRFVPVEIIDVAGLVPGAHEGKGLGNKFLDDLRQADVLIHVVDASGNTNEKGEAVSPGSHDPVQDIRFLEKEIELWMVGILEKNWSKFSRSPMNEKTERVEGLTRILSGLGITSSVVDVVLTKTSLQDKRFSEWKEEDKRVFISFLRKRAKPIVIAANKGDLPHAKENISRMQREFPEMVIISCSAEAELTLRKAEKKGLVSYFPGDDHFEIVNLVSEEQEKALNYIREHVFSVWKNTGVQQLLDETVFSVLKYVAIFPGSTKGFVDSEGRTMPDCFLMPPHSTALDFAFRLHTDFGRKFVKAVDVRSRQLVGKDHELKQCDVIEIIAGK